MQAMSRPVPSQVTRFSSGYRFWPKSGTQIVTFFPCVSSTWQKTKHHGAMRVATKVPRGTARGLQGLLTTGTCTPAAQLPTVRIYTDPGSVASKHPSPTPAHTGNKTYRSENIKNKTQHSGG